ncbi:hypothetical protein PanWU01x14_126360 [Parasponia andersonii]|uniref:Uncharacterized protein n=1 Tax=Parasponia andersonii TaxID=3476 RepID=A0A2P5CSU0_PARAD|nr:hypothetical protein PanWU01x14_126360 [Parasponia andersonii]
MVLCLAEEKVEKTDDQPSSAYASVLGNLDWRVELDENIKPDVEKYNGSLSIMAAKLSYENESFIKNVVKNHWKGVKMKEFLKVGVNFKIFKD